MIPVKTLIEACEKRYGTPERVADRLGVSVQRLASLRTGYIPISAERMDKLCEIAGLTDEQRAYAVWKTVQSRSKLAEQMKRGGMAAAAVAMTVAAAGELPDANAVPSINVKAMMPPTIGELFQAQGDYR